MSSKLYRSFTTRQVIFILKSQKQKFPAYPFIVIFVHFQNEFHPKILSHLIYKNGIAKWVESYFYSKFTAPCEQIPKYLLEIQTKLDAHKSYLYIFEKDLEYFEEFDFLKYLQGKMKASDAKKTLNEVKIF